MSTDNPESLGPAQEVEVLNERASQLASSTAQLLCRETIEFVYEGVRVHLQVDKEQHEAVRRANFPVGEVLGSFVLQGTLTAPRKEGEFVRTFSTKVEPAKNTSGSQYMKLYIPVGDRMITDYEMPPLDEIDEIYIEHKESDETHWFAVNKVGLYEYIPFVLQEEDSSVLSDQGIWQWVDDRIPEGLETISVLLPRLTNWDTVHQRLEFVEEIQLADDL
jgi:hypothetical protein